LERLSLEARDIDIIPGLDIEKFIIEGLHDDGFFFMARRVGFDFYSFCVRPGGSFFFDEEFDSSFLTRRDGLVVLDHIASSPGSDGGDSQRHRPFVHHRKGMLQVLMRELTAEIIFPLVKINNCNPALFSFIRRGGVWRLLRGPLE